MALSASIVFEIRQGGIDLNGGGYKVGAGTVDYSLQNSAQVVIDNSTITCTTTGANSNTLTFTAGYTPSANDVGNVAHMASGTNINAGPYEITGQTSTTWTLAGAANLTGAGGAGSAIVGKMGGAKGTPGCLSTGSASTGGIGSSLVTGQKAWWQYNATAVTCSTSTAGPSGPCAIPSSVPFVLEGYDVTRGDRTGNRPIYKWTASSPGGLTYLFRMIGSNRQQFVNITADANTVALVGCFDVSTSRTGASDCVALNATQSTTIGFTGQQVLRCQANNCLTGFSGGVQNECDAVSCTTGYTGNTASTRCLARTCTTGFLASATNFLGDRCTADSCTTGFSVTGQGTLSSCLASNCTGTGFVLGSSLATLHNCASYNNVTIASGTPVLNEGPFANGNTLSTAISADPYIDRTNGDFRPNNNNPGGAQLRNAGIGVYGQTDNSDIGAVQHTDPAASGGIKINPGMSGGLR